MIANNTRRAQALAARRREETSRSLMSAALQSKTLTLARLNTCESGLTRQQAEASRQAHGPNLITRHRKDSLARRLAGAFINPFTCILIVLALISLATDVILAPPGEKNPVTVWIVTAMVLISGLLRFVQETRSGSAAEHLLKLIKTTCTVCRRETGPVEIPLEDVAVGDVVHLSAGDMIPADVRILSAKDLFVTQAALTGESAPVEKTAARGHEQASLTEQPCLAFMGTSVVSGSASAVVLATGDSTLFGSIAQTLQQAPAATSFQKGVNSVSWVLIRFMAVMVPVVFVLNGITKGDWLSAFTFAVSIAVGLTPEMLPMIVTTCLAKGAVSMSRRRAVVKNLNSIQDLGAMDILCTDKTGTLTQDQVVLEYHLDPAGEPDLRVLRHAFLNSYFQTGLKNLMDAAVIDRTRALSDGSLWGLDSVYRKVDEIPFDFQRRRMSVVVQDTAGKTQMITKGAVEEMLSVCAYVESDGGVQPLTAQRRRQVLEQVRTLNDDGLRVIAVAQKTGPSPEGVFSTADETEMVLIGYLAFLDPPKESAAAAIRALADCGVRVKILTGDNERVTRCICRMVGLEADPLMTGEQVDAMDDSALRQAAEQATVFAKLSPDQKARIVSLLRDSGHTVGYLGDGINDAPAMKAADVGISVDTAVDIAKESADVILLEKNLTVLRDGILEGRKTYANMIKYIKMTASSNFGNMLSVLIASAFIPYTPMASIQLILLNLIYDVSCTAIPWDNVDEEFLRVPRRWDASSIGSFMLWIGPTSSVFDLMTYLLTYFLLCPVFVPGAEGRTFNQIPASEAGVRAAYVMMAQAMWFVESMWTQTLVIHMIRTPKLPFLKSHASLPVTALTFAGIAILTAIPFTPLAGMIGLSAFPLQFFGWLAVIVLEYMLLATAMKRIYVRRYGELL